MKLESSSEEFKKRPIILIQGIPSFTNDRYLFSFAFHTLGLTSLARKTGWKKALANLPSSELKEYIINPRKTCFTSLLKVKSNSRILDLGAGWGSISFQLAKGFPSTTIYALDKTIESLLFLKAVKDQERLRNLKIMHGDAWDVPIIDEFFDHVIMMGVLEWVGESPKSKDPQEIQLKVLREIYRVLKKDGAFLLGIENRIGWQYFLGETDHSYLKYTSLMPRFFANIYCKLKTGKPYRTYTYTESGYKKLLAKIGFKQIKIYAVFKNYSSPLYISDLSSVKHVVKVLYENKKGLLATTFAKILPNFILRSFVPAYLITAVK